MTSSISVLLRIIGASIPGFTPPANIPNNNQDEVTDNLTSVLNTVYLWAGIICVIIIVTAGISYAISAGDPSKITKAKNTIIGAVAGLVIIIMAFAITAFVTGVF